MAFSREAWPELGARRLPIAPRKRVKTKIRATIPIESEPNRHWRYKEAEISMSACASTVKRSRSAAAGSCFTRAATTGANKLR